MNVARLRLVPKGWSVNISPSFSCLAKLTQPFILQLANEYRVTPQWQGLCNTLGCDGEQGPCPVIQ